MRKLIIFFLIHILLMQSVFAAIDVHESLNNEPNHQINKQIHCNESQSTLDQDCDHCAHSHFHLCQFILTNNSQHTFFPNNNNISAVTFEQFASISMPTPFRPPIFS